jgi:hypothetical protein
MRTHSPYGMELVDDCTKCPLRKEGYFCQMADGSVAAFGKAKFTTSYPVGALLFVEVQVPRGVYMLCQGQVKLTTAALTPCNYGFLPSRGTVRLGQSDSGECIAVARVVTKSSRVVAVRRMSSGSHGYKRLRETQLGVLLRVLFQTSRSGKPPKRNS